MRGAASNGYLGRRSWRFRCMGDPIRRLCMRLPAFRDSRRVACSDAAPATNFPSRLKQSTLSRAPSTLPLPHPPPATMDPDRDARASLDDMNANGHGQAPESDFPKSLPVEAPGAPVPVPPKTDVRANGAVDNVLYSDVCRQIILLPADNLLTMIRLVSTRYSTASSRA